MFKKVNRNEVRKRKHARIRYYIKGTQERPRLAVFRSNKHIYAQIINDDTAETIVQASSLDKDFSAGANGSNIEAAKAVGTLVAERAKEAGIETVVFDRGGYVYHGRVAALADAAREAGLNF